MMKPGTWPEGGIKMGSLSLHLLHLALALGTVAGVLDLPGRVLVLHGGRQAAGGLRGAAFAA